MVPSTLLRLVRARLPRVNQVVRNHNDSLLMKASVAGRRADARQTPGAGGAQTFMARRLALMASNTLKRYAPR
jgi:hypothetical protein